ncbi:DUF998_domain-containing protein [Hexamita inflata]|uniref:DUF998_domain-containing protein n=1 Tax=Hexamita inflata TaxID=28002 RepID=A0ABP1KRF1_9EUKA
MQIRSRNQKFDKIFRKFLKTTTLGCLYSNMGRWFNSRLRLEKIDNQQIQGFSNFVKQNLFPEMLVFSFIGNQTQQELTKRNILYFNKLQVNITPYMLMNIIKGEFTSKLQLHIYGLITLLIFSFFMFSAQIGFNRNILESTGSTKDYYAPWKYTFSKLGSFDEQYNPKYYLLFSACLWSLIVLDIPMSFFIYRRNRLISQFGASVSQLFYIIGWIGIILDGCFCAAQN